MSRNQPPSQPRRGSGRQPSAEDLDPEDRDSQRGTERIGSASKPREDEDEGYKDDHEGARDKGEDEGEDKGREYRLSKLPRRDDRAEDDEEEALEEADILEVLDRDDLTKMEGSDA